MIRDGWVGKSKCMFFKVNDVIRLYEKAIETDPFGLYGLNKTDVSRCIAVNEPRT